jgi:hypothetical protein
MGKDFLYASTVGGRVCLAYNRHLDEFFSEGGIIIFVFACTLQPIVVYIDCLAMLNNNTSCH